MDRNNLQALITRISLNPVELTAWCAEHIPPPGSGAGCHPMLLTAANYAIAAGLEKAEAVKLIEEGVPKGKRLLQPREVANAVNRAALDVPCVVDAEGGIDTEAWAEFNAVRKTGGSTRRTAPANPEMIPDIAYALTDSGAVIEGLTRFGRIPGGKTVDAKPGPDLFKQPAGIALPADLHDFLRDTYHADQTVLMGDTFPVRKAGTNIPLDSIPFRTETKPVTEWMALLRAKPFNKIEQLIPQLMADPHCGDPKPPESRPDGLSYRARECFQPQFLVLENDEAPMQLQAEMARGMIELGLPVAWIVYSGGKSLHVVLRVIPDPQHTLLEYRAFARGVAKPLGYDPHSVYYSTYTRTPFVTRDNGNLQQLLYWDDTVKGITIRNLAAKIAAAGGSDSKARPSTNRPYYRRIGVKWKLDNEGNLVTPATREYIELGPGEFSEELEVQGFHTTDDDTLVQIENHVMDEVSAKSVQRHPATSMINDINTGISDVWLKSNHPARAIERCNTRDIRKWYTSRKAQRIVSSDPNLLSPVPIPRHMDTIDTSFFYDGHKVMVVHNGKFDVMDYNDLNGYVAKGSILPIPVDMERGLAGGSAGVFAQFVWNISGRDQQNYDTIRAVIGFLLWRFKDKRFAWSPVIIDQLAGVLGESTGGCGKSLLSKLIGFMRQMCELSGKRYDNESKFALQLLSRLDDLLLIDDVRKGHDYDNDFNLITEGIEVERKGQTPLVIPFEESPKVIFTSNSVPSDTSLSMSRRFSIIELAPYYNQHRTPATEFKHQLLDDWLIPGGGLELEYHRYVMFCMTCVRDYISGKLSRPMPRGEYHYKQYMNEVKGDDILLRYFENYGFPTGEFDTLWLADRINESGLSTGMTLGKYDDETIKEHVDALRKCFPGAGIPPSRGQTTYMGPGERRGHKYYIANPANIQLAPKVYTDIAGEEEVEDFLK